MTRRILFCTIGSTPQVVTETVYALRKQRDWTPSKVHIVTTTFALPRLREELQGPSGHLARMFAGRPPLTTIHVPRLDGSIVSLDASGKADMAALEGALRDVNSEEQAAAMGKAILSLMEDFVADEASQVHLSLAGGRKTMSAHALLALTLLGRETDEASHVLVNPAEKFEDHPEFWHPDQGGLIHRKEDLRKEPQPQPSLDPKEAEITLVLTPTPLMRYEVKSYDKLAKRDLKQVVDDIALARRLRTDPEVRLDVGANTVSLCGVTRKLSPKFFAMFRLLFEAKRGRWPGVGERGAGAGFAGWLSPSAICFNKSPSGEQIDAIYLGYLRDAFDAEFGDAEDRESVEKWRKDVVQQNDPYNKLKYAADLVRTKRFLAALTEQFGAPAVEALVGFKPERDKAKGKESRFGLHVSANALLA
jgi:CRISPR-associated protein (TIGR02584 family)